MGHRPCAFQNRFSLLRSHQPSPEYRENPAAGGSLPHGAGRLGRQPRSTLRRHPPHPALTMKGKLLQLMIKPIPQNAFNQQIITNLWQTLKLRGLKLRNFGCKKSVKQCCGYMPVRAGPWCGERLFIKSDQILFCCVGKSETGVPACLKRFLSVSSLSGITGCASRIFSKRSPRPWGISLDMPTRARRDSDAGSGGSTDCFRAS